MFVEFQVATFKRNTWQVSPEYALAPQAGKKKRHEDKPVFIPRAVAKISARFI